MKACHAYMRTTTARTTKTMVQTIAWLQRLHQGHQEPTKQGKQLNSSLVSCFLFRPMCNPSACYRFEV